LYGAIREQVTSTPDATLEELQAWLSEAHGIEASTTLIWETLDKLNLTFKKRPCTPLNRTALMSCGRARPSDESGRPRFHRRNVDQNQHGSASWTFQARQAVGRQDAAWPLENRNRCECITYATRC
jgi:hypothetical protein